jgi:hypothetical protein
MVKKTAKKKASCKGKRKTVAERSNAAKKK